MSRYRTGPKHTVGLIALDRDVVIEEDLHQLGPAASLVTTRIRLEKVGNIPSLLRLGEQIPEASHLLAAASPALIAFGCTSAVAVLGADRVAREISDSSGGLPSVNPLSAFDRGLRHLGARRLSIITPYATDISSVLADWFDGRGFVVVNNTRVERGRARRYSEISPEHIVEAVLSASTPAADATVIACTDLRALHLIDSLEAITGRPVITSNQALAWTIGKALGEPEQGPGTLFNLSRAAD